MPAFVSELRVVFNQVDNWFSDISLDQPISQFLLDEDRRQNVCRAEPKKVTYSKSNTKKATTANNSQRKRVKSTSLDLLARDLEILLETDEDKHDIKHRSSPLIEQELFFYVLYSDDSLTLLDDTVGSCCTIQKDNQIKKESTSGYREFCVVMNNLDENAYERYKSEQSKDLNVLTPMPTDHDYLSKPRTKPLASNNRMPCSKNDQRRSSVLIIEALKRFAPFSDKVRALTIKHDALPAS